MEEKQHTVVAEGSSLLVGDNGVETNSARRQQRIRSMWVLLLVASCVAALSAYSHVLKRSRSDTASDNAAAASGTVDMMSISWGWSSIACPNESPAVGPAAVCLHAFCEYFGTSGNTQNFQPSSRYFCTRPAQKKKCFRTKSDLFSPLVAHCCNATPDRGRWACWLWFTRHVAKGSVGCNAHSVRATVPPELSTSAGDVC